VKLMTWRRRMGRRVSRIGSTGVVCVLLAGCGASGGAVPAAPTAAPAAAGGAAYKLALISEITGLGSSLGVPSQAGAKAAAAAINAVGGVKGHQLEITVYDGQSTPTTAQAATVQAIGDKPDVITGFLTSGDVAATAASLNGSGIPYLGINYTTTATDANPNWFTLSASSYQVAAGIVNGLKGQFGGSLKGKVIAVEAVTQPTADLSIAELTAQLQAEGASLGPVIRDPLTMTSWTSQATNVMDSHADAFVVFQSAPNVATVVKALGAAGFKGPMVSSDASNSDSLLSQVNLPNFYAVREGGNSTQGTDLYQLGITAGGSPSAIPETQYAPEFAAVYTIAKALQGCDFPCTASAFSAQVKQISDYTPPNNSLLGPIDFTKGNAGLTAAQLFGWDPAGNKSGPQGSPVSLKKPS
jgi:ABC-type branched-subunit amino acid transport system substrate-binding protein